MPFACSKLVAVALARLAVAWKYFVARLVVPEVAKLNQYWNSEKPDHDFDHKYIYAVSSVEMIPQGLGATCWQISSLGLVCHRMRDCSWSQHQQDQLHKFFLASTPSTGFLRLPPFNLLDGVCVCWLVEGWYLPVGVLLQLSLLSLDIVRGKIAR